MNYFLIAGEASGDLHGADLIAHIRRLDPDARFTFLGGDKMAQAARCQPVVHYRRMAYMGFSEVLRHLGDIRANFRTARQAMRDSQPHRVVLIDYPGFNLKMAAFAHRLGLPVYYYISPKVWAWKRWRVRKMRRHITRVLSILPFEVPFLERHRVPVTYVGNPTYGEIQRWLEAHPAPSRRQGVALVPGSRQGEIRANLPVMVEACRLCGIAERDIAIAGAPGIDTAIYAQYAPGIRVVSDGTWALMRCARAALVTSGTATLECAVIGTPQVALYRSNGSRLAYWLMSHILSIPYVTLPNLVADAPAIPELLLHHCTPQAVAAHLLHILDNPAAQDTSRAVIRQRLSTPPNAAAAAASLIAGTIT